MCRAFLGADYYGGSVAIGLAPRRRSRVPSLLDMKRDVGTSFVPLSDLVGHRPLAGRFRQLPRDCRMPVAPHQTWLSGDVRLHRWELRFKQSSLCHIARALQDGALHAFRHLPLRRHALVPFGFRRQVSRWPRGQFFRTPPTSSRDLAVRYAAHQEAIACADVLVEAEDQGFGGGQLAAGAQGHAAATSPCDTKGSQRSGDPALSRGTQSSRPAMRFGSAMARTSA